MYNLLLRAIIISFKHFVLQPDVLETIIPYLETDPPSCLPYDESGNTAAHLAAQEGHLHCLQARHQNKPISLMESF